MKSIVTELALDKRNLQQRAVYEKQSPRDGGRRTVRWGHVRQSFSAALQNRDARMLGPRERSTRFASLWEAKRPIQNAWGAAEVDIRGRRW